MPREGGHCRAELAGTSVKRDERPAKPQGYGLRHGGQSDGFRTQPQPPVGVFYDAAFSASSTYFLNHTGTVVLLIRSVPLGVTSAIHRDSSPELSKT